VAAGVGFVVAGANASLGLGSQRETGEGLVVWNSLAAADGSFVGRASAEAGDRWEGWACMGAGGG